MIIIIFNQTLKIPISFIIINIIYLKISIVNMRPFMNVYAVQNESDQSILHK